MWKIFKADLDILLDIQKHVSLKNGTNSINILYMVSHIKVFPMHYYRLLLNMYLRRIFYSIF